MKPIVIQSEHYGIDRRLENHMRRQMQRMLEAGFSDHHRQFVRSALEMAYEQGRKDALNGRIVENVITEDVIMQTETL